jgi:Lon protease-like protein
MDDDGVIGVFPLELVMLPGEAVPLHLFEPRYRQLLADSVLEQQPFAICRSVGEAMERIGCAGTFETVVRRLADGRLHVIVRGAARIEVLAPAQEGRLYDTAVVRELPDEDADAPAELAQRVGELFREVGGGAEIPEEPAAVPLSYRIAGVVDMPLDAKQGLLESRSEEARLETLASLLERAGRGAAHARLAARRASTNGRVTSPEH